MRYAGPDAAAREYQRLRDAFESPRGYDPLDRADVCAHCGEGPALPKGGGLKRDRWGNVKLDAQGRMRREEQVFTCMACGEPWKGVEVAWLKATGRCERVRDPEEGFRLEDRDKLMRLRPIFESRPSAWTQKEWNFHRIAYLLFLDPRFGSYAAAAEVGGAYFTNVPTGNVIVLFRWAKELVSYVWSLFGKATDAPRPWTEGTVRWAVERMRRLVTERLAAAQMLAIPEGGEDVGRLSA